MGWAPQRSQIFPSCWGNLSTAFPRDTSLKVATGPFPQAPWNGRWCWSPPPLTPLWAGMLWGSISSPAVPSNAASAPRFITSASPFVTGTDRGPPSPAHRRLSPTGAAASRGAGGGEGWPERRLSGITSWMEVTSAASEGSWFHDYIWPKGKVITQGRLSGEAQAHRFREIWRQRVP